MFAKENGDETWSSVSRSLRTYAYLVLVLVQSFVRALIVLSDLVKKSSALVDSHWVGPGSVSKQRTGKMAAPGGF